MSYDLLYGRAGFLWAALFLNKYLGEGTVPDHLLLPIVAAILSGGRVGAADHQACPLLYRQATDLYLSSSFVSRVSRVRTLSSFGLLQVPRDTVLGCGEWISWNLARLVTLPII